MFFCRCFSFPFPLLFETTTQANTSVDNYQTADTHFDPTQNAADQNINPNLRVFTLSELKTATNNFNASNKIGEGGFAIVYMGTVNSSTHLNININVAVKVAKKGQHGYKPWVTEVNVLGEIEHPNLVKLIGYCNEDNGNVNGNESQLILVYEYMANKSLDCHLSANSSHAPLLWATRLKIALHAATGLVYLHEGTSREIIFRDFKPSNILLDDELNAKLSDFGFARNGPQDGRTHISTMWVGTKGYSAPEYVQTGRLTSKIDVWSFGIFLEELITGRPPHGQKTSENNPPFLKWWVCCYAGCEKSTLVVDPRLKGNYSEKSMQKVELIAKKCLVKEAKSRPTMSEVLEMVKEAIELENQQLPN